MEAASLIIRSIGTAADNVLVIAFGTQDQRMLIALY